MASKVNIVLDDVKCELESLPESGMRSRVINAALHKELASIRRRRISDELDHLRRKTKPVSTNDIVPIDPTGSWEMRVTTPA
jgi:hypothetical protein